LKISNRDRRGGLAGLLMSHPPLEERIKALELGV
jgi:Zn-dependent protease with chaperone function